MTGAQKITSPTRRRRLSARKPRLSLNADVGWQIDKDADMSTTMQTMLMIVVVVSLLPMIIMAIMTMKCERRRENGIKWAE